MGRLAVYKFAYLLSIIFTLLILGSVSYTHLTLPTKLEV